MLLLEAYDKTVDYWAAGVVIRQVLFPRKDRWGPGQDFMRPNFVSSEKSFIQSNGTYFGPKIDAVLQNSVLKVNASERNFEKMRTYLLSSQDNDRKLD